MVVKLVSLGLAVGCFSIVLRTLLISISAHVLGDQLASGQSACKLVSC
jgi:hypothetical protein